MVHRTILRHQGLDSRFRVRALFSSFCFTWLMLVYTRTDIHATCGATGWDRHWSLPQNLLSGHDNSLVLMLSSFFFFHPLSKSEPSTALLLLAVCFVIEGINMRYCYAVFLFLSSLEQQWAIHSLAAVGCLLCDWRYEYEILLCRLSDKHSVQGCNMRNSEIILLGAFSNRMQLYLFWFSLDHWALL